MRKLVAIPLVIVGAVIICGTGWYLFGPRSAGNTTIYGYHPVYAGLAGVGMLTVGLLLRNE
jgi:hypothetical protein